MIDDLEENATDERSVISIVIHIASPHLVDDFWKAHAFDVLILDVCVGVLAFDEIIDFCVGHVVH
jgi:hypothetical protein